MSERDDGMTVRVAYRDTRKNGNRAFRVAHAPAAERFESPQRVARSHARVRNVLVFAYRYEDRPGTARNGRSRWGSGVETADDTEVAVGKGSPSVLLDEPRARFALQPRLGGWIPGRGTRRKLIHTVTFKGHGKRTRRVYRREKRPVKGKIKK